VKESEIKGANGIKGDEMERNKMKGKEIERDKTKWNK
jgi:hypothetical protein